MPSANALPRSTPEAQGIPSAVITTFVESITTGLNEIHSVMLVRSGHVVAEGWWRPYAAARPHSMYSVSKSFTATAIGLAIDEGLLALDDTVVSLLPDDAPEVISGNLAAMRVRHLLSMSTGHANDTLEALTRTEENWARGILAMPVDLEPGTTFIYNSGATYLLSAILARVTGMRLLNYLTPRLFTPLGIEGATWEQCPRGIDTGGWGLSITTEELARFGQLYLQRGVWNGVGLVAERWVDASTSSQVSNGDPSTADDWTQGYGYQFWRCQHGAYRADGAFGQLAIVMPEQDAVLVLTGAMQEARATIEAAWKHLLPALNARTSAEPLPADAAAHAALSQALGRLELGHPSGSSTSPTSADISGTRFDVGGSSSRDDADITAVSLDADDGHTVLTIWTSTGHHRITCGYGEWIRGDAPFPDGRVLPVAASAAWSDENTWSARLQFFETPFVLALTLRFDGDGVAVEIVQNVSLVPIEPVKLVGRRPLPD